MGECTLTNEPRDSTIDVGSDPLPPNQAEVLRVVQNACDRGGNSADFQAQCEAMAATDDTNGVRNSLKAETADDAAAARSSGMQTANIQVTAVDGRIGTLRGGGGAGFTASGFNMSYGDVSVSGGLLASFISAFDTNNPEFMQANATANDEPGFLEEFGRWGAWISGRVIFGSKDPTDAQVEYDFDTAGLTFGMDYRFSDNLVAGVAVGYANTEADLKSKSGEMDTKGYSVSLYGTYFKGDSFYLGGSIGYGDNDYDLTRQVSYSLAMPSNTSLPAWAFDVEQTLGAKYSGDQFSAAFSGGWDYNKNGWTFGPTFRIDWVKVNVNSYDEVLLSSNAGVPMQYGWAAQIDKQKYESLQPSVGFAFSKAVSASWGIFIPQGYIDVISELKDGGILVTGRFRGDGGGETFGLQTDDFEETFVRAGLGFGLVLKNNKSAFFMADGDLGRDLLTTYYLNAGFRWQF